MRGSHVFVGSELAIKQNPSKAAREPQTLPDGTIKEARPFVLKGKNVRRYDSAEEAAADTARTGGFLYGHGNQATIALTQSEAEAWQAEMRAAAAEAEATSIAQFVRDTLAAGQVTLGIPVPEEEAKVKDEPVDVIALLFGDLDAAAPAAAE